MTRRPVRICNRVSWLFGNAPGVRAATWGLAIVLAGRPAQAGGTQPVEVAGHRPVVAGEHPRLVVRQQRDIRAWRAKAAEPWGRKVVARMRRSGQDPRPSR